MPDDQATPASVFITYARRDTPFVDELADLLAAAGLAPWVDTRSIPATADWMERIQRGIEGSAAYLYVISPAAVASQMCAVELAHAARLGKRIVPVLAEDTDLGQLPAAIAGIQWIDVRDRGSRPDWLSRLLAAVRTDLDWVDRHTWLLEASLRWWRRDEDPAALLGGRLLAEAEAFVTEAGPTEAAGGAGSTGAAGGAGAGKEPRPTPLQVDFVRRSRLVADERTALGHVLTGFPLLDGGRVAEARENFERAHALYTRHGISPLPAEVGRWALTRLASRPLLRLPSTPVGIALVGWAMNGAAMVVVSRDGAVGLYQTDGTFLVDAQLPVAEVSAAALDPDGMRLAVADQAGRVVVWDIVADEALADWPGHGARATALAWHGNDTLATGAFDGTVRVWSVSAAPDDRLRADLPGHRTPVTALAFLDDGGLVSGSLGAASLGDDAVNLAGMGEDETLRRWDLRRAQQVHDFGGFDASVFDILVAADGSLFTCVIDVTGEATGVRRWDPDGGRYLGGHPVPGDRLAAVGALLAVADDHTVALWDLTREEPVSLLDTAPPGGAAAGAVTALAVGPDHATVLTGTADGHIALWKAVEDRCVRAIDTGFRAAGPVTARQLDGVAVAAATVRVGDISTDWWMREVLDGTGRYPVTAFDVDTGLALRTVAAQGSGITAVAVVGTDIVVAGMDDRLEFAALGPGEPRVPADLEERPVTMHATPDGRSLLLADLTEAVKVYRPAEGHWAAPFTGHHAPVRAAVAVDDAVAVSGDDGGEILVWGIADHDIRQRFEHPAGGPTALAVGAGGRRLVVAGGDGVVRCFDLAAPADAPQLMYGHAGRVNDVCVSADGTVAASVGDDRTMRIWHVPSGRQLIAVREHRQPAVHVDFLAGERGLISAGDDGRLVVYDLAYPDRLARHEAGGGADDAGDWYMLRGEWSRAFMAYRDAAAGAGPRPSLAAALCLTGVGEPLDALAWLPGPDADPGPRTALVRHAVAEAAADTLAGILRHGDVAAVAEVLGRWPAGADTAGPTGLRPLHVVALTADDVLVSLLLSRGADVDGRTSDRSATTALHLACADGFESVAHRLLGAGADPNATTRDGWTPLHEAVTATPGVVNLLLTNRSDPNAASHAGYTPLHRAAVKGRADQARILLTAGASVTARDDGGLTALHFAASSGDEATVEALLAAGADPAARTATGDTPADIAMRHNHFTAVRRLRFER